MGPIVLFDKSFLEMLNIDEAAVFDVLYLSVICPVFYTEVLADLSKEPPGERTAERIVADVAKKTPILHSTPNTMHTSICMTELLGNPVDMRRVPVRAGGRPVRRSDGTVGVVYDEAPEAKAFNRWQRGRFREVEHEFAARWREQLLRTDHAAMAKLAKTVLKIHATPRNLQETMAIAREVVNGMGQRFMTLKTAYALLGLPPALFPKVQKRWMDEGGPHLAEFAPYTAHCLLVDVFFHVAVDKKLIDPGRASNRVDMAYLFYLPFAMIFVSNDKLHRRVVPLFLQDNQMFVFGDDLKQDLARLDAYYSSRPEAERAEGLMRLAGYPPDDDSYLTTRIWKQMGLRMRPAPEEANPADAMPKPAVAKLIAMVNDMKASAKGPAGMGPFTRDEVDDASHVVIERLVPLHRGKWRLMPPGVETKTE